MKRKPPEAQLALQVEKLASAIREFNPEKIILFGSAARGDYTAESDLDVVVVMESDKNFFERTYEVMRRCRVDRLVNRGMVVILWESRSNRDDSGNRP